MRHYHDLFWIVGTDPLRWSYPERRSAEVHEAILNHPPHGWKVLECAAQFDPTVRQQANSREMTTPRDGTRFTAISRRDDPTSAKPGDFPTQGWSFRPRAVAPRMHDAYDCRADANVAGTSERESRDSQPVAGGRQLEEI